MIRTNERVTKKKQRLQFVRDTGWLSCDVVLCVSSENISNKFCTSF